MTKTTWIPTAVAVLACTICIAVAQQPAVPGKIPNAAEEQLKQQPQLALIYACSESYKQPEISAQAAKWASEFVDHQTRRMLFMAAEHVSEGDFDARCKRVVVELRKWKEKHGNDWMPYWRLNRKLPWTKRDHEEIRVTLRDQQLIEFEERGTRGRRGLVYRLL